MTWSPFLTEATPGPPSTTPPAPSWPRMAGNRPSGSLPESVNSSVWQMPVALISTITSPARGPSRLTWVIASGLPGSEATAARTSMKALPVEATSPANQSEGGGAMGACWAVSSAVLGTKLRGTASRDMSGRGDNIVRLGCAEQAAIAEELRRHWQHVVDEGVPEHLRDLVLRFAEGLEQLRIKAVEHQHRVEPTERE